MSKQNKAIERAVHAGRILEVAIVTGCTREEAVAALRRCLWNEDAAIRRIMAARSTP